MHSSKIISKLRRTTYKDLWEGDFDGDGIPNIDDARPFDKNNSRRVRSEVSLNDGWKRLTKERIRFKKDINLLKNEFNTTQSRVKSKYSIIGKQLGRNLNQLGDIGGLRIVLPKRKDVYKKVQEISNKYPKCNKINENKQICIKGIEDKYKINKRDNWVNPYMGVHIDLSYNNRPYEIQIKTKPMQPLHDKMHSCFKRSNNKSCLTKFRNEAITKYKKGY